MDIWHEMNCWNKYLAYKLGASANNATFHIELCENPGWWVKVNLAGTPFAECRFDKISHNVDANRFQTSSTDWYHCAIKDKKFDGAGDPDKLEFILTTFFDWLKQNGYVAKEWTPDDVPPISSCFP